MRAITITLMLGLTLVISVSAAGGTSLGFFDSVKEFFGLETTITSVSPDKPATADVGESKSAAIIENGNTSPGIVYAAAGAPNLPSPEPR